MVNSTTVFYFLFSGAAFDGLIIHDMPVTGSVEIRNATETNFKSFYFTSLLRRPFTC